MAAQTEILVEGRKIGKCFGSRVILQDLSIKIELGKHLLISGPSGSGKTTLLRLLALLEPVDEGSIWYRNQNVTALAFSPQTAQEIAGIRIGYVSQDRDLWPHLTVKENTDLALTLRKMPAQAVEETTSAVLNALGLENERNKFPAELSGGQRQRCAIARCLVHHPEVLLLDEITASLDAENIRKVMNAVEVAVAEGATVALVSHERELPTDLSFSRLEIL